MFKFRLHHCAFVLICLTIFSISCAPPAQYPPSFRVKKESLDFTPLKGRKILIDPGHGGQFTGAVGIHGLRESDINLAVALHLWGLLKHAGAKPILTRSADVDLCSPGYTDLFEDLVNRVNVNVEAELFISIHHNSNTNDRKKNATQVYYKLMDPGPSKDLANCVAQELKKGQSLDEVSVLPGNYLVLRKTGAVAILGEASFISNPKNEERLALSNQLQREAEDYFLGILTYFQKGIPEVSDYQPNSAILTDAFPQLRAKISGGKGGEAIDPKTPKLFLDGVPLPASFDPQDGIITYSPDKPLQNGWHILFAQARNLNGNATWIKPVQFCIFLPPAKILISPVFQALPADGKSSTPIQIDVLDRYNNPVIDGTILGVKAFSGELDRCWAGTLNGRATAYFVSPKRPEEAVIEAKFKAISGKTVIKCGPIEDALMRITIKDTHQNLLDTVMVQAGDKVLGVSDETGSLFIKSNKAEKNSITLSKPGYKAQKGTITFTKGVFKAETFVLTPREDGILLGKKFLLDPEPKDENTEKDFGLNADSEKASLLVAQKLQTLLKEAGAMTWLTRDSLEAHPTPGDRVVTGERFGGEYFITITHRKNKPYVTHYYLSQTGKDLSQKIAESLGKESRVKNVTVQEGTDFTIVHPSYPSILINFGKKHVGKHVKEKIVDQEARCIYQGLVEFLKTQDEK